MIVQWCCKGVAEISEDEVRTILSNGVGLRCRGWLSAGAAEPFAIGAAIQQLTEHNLNLHVNNYAQPMLRTGQPFCDSTPFISLSAGCVDRDTTTKTNVTHRALRTALEFAVTDYTQPSRPRCPGWVLVCYVLVSPNRSTSIPSVAEEIRELNHNRAYSEWHWQGEVAAKINVPSTQILCAQRWEPAGGDLLKVTDLLVNLAFTHPSAILDERNML
ncbi:hypothetical protein GCM10022419_061880 [Nonomuraea rosea]|uniref:Uncharacterized protein n=1 Tax=Nonomuraea rosea TaxID=638574 RepID=A0ABP6XUP4_9ACTN